MRGLIVSLFYSFTLLLTPTFSFLPFSHSQMKLRWYQFHTQVLSIQWRWIYLQRNLFQDTWPNWKQYWSLLKSWYHDKWTIFKSWNHSKFNEYENYLKQTHTHGFCIFFIYFLYLNILGFLETSLSLYSNVRLEYN